MIGAPKSVSCLVLLARWLVILGVFVAAGCLGGETPKPLGFLCSTDFECSGAMVCRYGHCRSECVLNSDCPPGTICVGTTDIRVCTLATESGCTDDSECPEGLRCSPFDGQCRSPCDEDRCPDQYGCYLGPDGNSWCLEPEFGECGDDYCVYNETHACPECFCSDGFCGSDENVLTCWVDCRACGDELCSLGESAESCPDDCPPTCGDGSCQGDETARSCPVDCDARCGDGECTHEETVVDCPGDCDDICGDGHCAPASESAATCPGDCPHQCGDDLCTGDETIFTCPADCPNDCGDGECYPGETVISCPDDCPGECGDDYCSEVEDHSSCPGDCPVVCGDELCSDPETAGTCPGDCPAECGDGLCTHDEIDAECFADCEGCGDGDCLGDEDAESCPADCGPVCGDGICSNPPENPTECLVDCTNVCGDGHCADTDTVLTCPGDCPAACGDGLCTHTETHASCALDCTCGDGLCEGDETLGSCPADCTCGNGVCDGVETLGSCPADCTCGNGVCDGIETSTDCPADCTCGNGVCDIGEDNASCFADCFCTNGTCDVDEDVLGCPEDCLADCGDGLCTHLETGASCSTDCHQVLKIVAGNTHTCVIIESGEGNDAGFGGTVRCWGANGFGQLGLGNTDDHINAACLNGMVALPEPAVQLAAGQNHTCAQLVSGLVSCWGSNGDSQLGASPPGPGEPVEVPLGGLASDIAAGSGHSCALLLSGSVECWGRNSSGQLGTGSTNATLPPSPATVFNARDDIRALRIGAGANHTCVLTGVTASPPWAMHCVGMNNYDQVGDPSNDPVYLSDYSVDLGAGEVEALSLGAWHTCAIRAADQQLHCWGWGFFGQLGDGSATGSGPPHPLDVGVAVSQVAAGSTHTCVVYSSGEVSCRGTSSNGMLGYGPGAPFTIGDVYGDGTGEAFDLSADRFVQVIGGGETIEQVALGAEHSCVLLVDSVGDHVVRCWGSGASGRLGYALPDNYGDDEDPITAGDVPVVCP